MPLYEIDTPEGTLEIEHEGPVESLAPAVKKWVGSRKVSAETIAASRPAGDSIGNVGTVDGYAPPEVASSELEDAPRYTDETRSSDERELMRGYVQESNVRVTQNVDLGATDPRGSAFTGYGQPQTEPDSRERGMISSAASLLGKDIMPEGDSALAGVSRALIGFGDVMTTPTNLAQLESMIGAPRAIANAAGAAFLPMMMSGGAEQVSALQTAETPGQMAEAGLGAALSFGMGALGTAAAASRGSALPRETASRRTTVSPETLLRSEAPDSAAREVAKMPEPDFQAMIQKPGLSDTLSPESRRVVENEIGRRNEARKLTDAGAPAVAQAVLETTAPTITPDEITYRPKPPIQLEPRPAGSGLQDGLRPAAERQPEPPGAAGLSPEEQRVPAAEPASGNLPESAVTPEPLPPPAPTRTEPSPELATPAAAVEPWQMTEAEYRQTWDTPEFREKFPNYKGEQDHGDIVEGAIESGKPVPEKVRAEYAANLSEPPTESSPPVAPEAPAPVEAPFGTLPTAEASTSLSDNIAEPVLKQKKTRALSAKEMAAKGMPIPASKAYGTKLPDNYRLNQETEMWESAPVEAPKDATPETPSARQNPFDTSETSRRLSELRDTKPRPIDKYFGKSGGTPEQRAAHEAKIKKWNSEYRKAQKEHKELVEKSNEWLRTPPPARPSPLDQLRELERDAEATSPAPETVAVTNPVAEKLVSDLEKVAKAQRDKTGAMERELNYYEPEELAQLQAHLGTADAEPATLAFAITKKSKLAEAETPSTYGKSEVTSEARPDAPEVEQLFGDDYVGGPGAMEPREAAAMEAAAKSGATSTKNAVMDAERAARGADAILPEARITNAETLDAAEAAIEANPNRGQEVVEKLLSGESVRNISTQEEAILLVEKVRLRNERETQATRAADQSLTPEERVVARQQWEALEAKINQMDQATHASGAEWGRMGQFRQRLLRDDFTFEAMERRARLEKGDALTPGESAKIKEQATKIEGLQKQLEELTKAKDEKARVDAVTKAVQEINQEIDPRITSIAEKIVKGLESQADAALKRIRARRSEGRLNSLPVEDLADYAIVGASKIARKSLDFARWSAEMVKDLGEMSGDVLKEIWDASNAKIDELGAKTGKDAEAVTRAVRKADSSEGIERNLEGIKTRLAEGDKMTDLAAYIRSLAKNFVKSGIKERDPLIDAVHGAIKDLAPDFTRRQTMDAISGYGDFKALDTSPVAVTLRDLKGQMQQVGKIEDMIAKKAPAKTGVERRTPSDEERRLLKEVNELKKKGGFEVTDPAKQLKSAMDAIKTRLRNEIADIDLAIATGERIPNKTGSPDYDVEATALRAQRDAKKAQYDELFPKAPMTEAQQIAMAGRALDRSITALEADLKDGMLYPEKTSRKLTSPELEVKRARLNELRAERDLLRSLDDGKLEEIALKAYKSRTLRSIAQMQDRMAKKDFAPKRPKDLPKLDKEATDLKLEINKVRQEYAKDRLDWTLANRTTGQKLFQESVHVLNTARAVQTSFDLSAVFRQGGFITISHPIRAAKAIPSMFRALASEKGRFAVNEEIISRPTAELYQKAKLFIHDPHDSRLSKMEEAYMSRWAAKIPGVAASERAYTTFLNRLRADSFDALVRAFESDGKKLSIEEAKILANYVNVATGRGNLAGASGSAISLNAAFFSPRYVVSRFEMLAGQPMWGGNAKTRKLVAKEYARFLGGIAVIYALGQAAGATVETDPTKSDFGKLRFGNSRIDPLSGLQQVTVFTSRLGTSLKKVAMGEKFKYGEGDFMGRFLRSKLAPAFATVVDLGNGKDILGKEVTLKSAALRMIFPLSVGDIYNTMKDQGVPAGTALTLLVIFGMGVQSYPEKEKKTKESSSVLPPIRF